MRKRIYPKGTLYQTHYKKNPCVFESKIEEMIEKVVAKKINEIKTNEVILHLCTFEMPIFILYNSCIFLFYFS
jgi:hypothetical protein